MATTKKTTKTTEATETAETTEATETAETTEATETAETTGEKMVIIKIPRERKDQEDVFVGVNERTWLIKRGVEVEVPACVAEVLKHRDEMLDIISEFEDAHASAM